MERNELFYKREFRNEYHKLWVNIFFTSNYLKNIFQQQLEKFNVTHVQYRILKLLKSRHPEPVSMSELKENMIDHISDFTRLSDRLEEKELIIREQDALNRRKVNMRLTEKGLLLVQQAEKEFQDFENELSMLTPAELAILNELLIKIRENKQIENE